MIYRHFTKTILAAVLSLTLFLTGCGGSLLLESGSDAAEGVSGNSEAEESVSIEDTGNEDNEGTSSEEDALPEAGGQEDSSGSEAGPENSDPVPEESEEEKEIPVIAPESFTVREDMEITFDPSWTYGEFSVINSGTAKLYYSHAAAPKDITVCINAGHGTQEDRTSRPSAIRTGRRKSRAAPPLPERPERSLSPPEWISLTARRREPAIWPSPSS